MAFTLTFTPAAGKTLTLAQLKTVPTPLALDGTKTAPDKASIRLAVLAKITDSAAKTVATAAAWAAAGDVPGAGEEADLVLKVKNVTGEHKSKLKVSGGTPKPAPVVVAKPLAVTYATPKVKKTCEGDAEFMKKIKSMIEAGTGYKGHGPVKAVGNANHTHVRDDDGFAFSWKGDVLQIEATGIKNNGAKPGFCGYDWSR